MIQEFGQNDWELVNAVPEPKNVWWDITRIVVSTGEDFVAPPSSA